MDPSPARPVIKKALRIAAGLLVVLLVIGAGAYMWASGKSSALLSRTIETHVVDFPIPFPLTPEERAALAPGEDPEAVAMQHAIDRGRHLIESRYVCAECHGSDLGGGVMIDDPMIGHAFGPNLTLGTGSKTLAYQPSDWDRAVRHGVKPGGAPSVMPAEDFQLVSDQELSDVVAYIRSLPPVDAEIAPVRLGPLGKVLMALGQLPLSADVIPSHQSAHPTLPPPPEASVEFGSHLAGVCQGCHQADLAGGPIPGGDPSWPPARNLTPSVDGLAGWSYDDFRRVLLEGRRPDGTAIRVPMVNILPYAANMTDVEMQALWAYLRSVPPVASRE
jgi:mono/diheme cytochrome c family protein